MTTTIIILVLLVVLAAFLVGLYNKLVRLRQNVRESWSAIDTELKRRYDLIPNLVETVKGYAAHESNTLENVIRARNAAMSTPDNAADKAQAEGALTGALRQVFALAESYPDLKANQNFVALQDQLNETENRISSSRRFYNANVKELNTATETFPSAMIAGSFGFKPEKYFEIENTAERDNVVVQF